MRKSPKKPAHDKKRLNWTILGAVGIVAAVIIVYIPAIRGGYVWDDDAYVTANKLLTEPDGLKQIWFSLRSPSQYFPLVYTTFRMEHALWGLNPLGYHLINVLLHAANVLLVWLVLRRLSIRGAWLAAAIFALHPVNVESVAWITERKNTLSTLFYLLTVLAWLKFTSKGVSRPWRYYALALVACQLALFAKTTACTLPAALLIVLWVKGEKVDWRRVAQVIPFLALGIAMGTISIWWERGHQGTRGPDWALEPVQRFLIAGHAIWFYLGKLIWPAKLTFSYRKWHPDPGNPMEYLWLVMLIALVAVLWTQRKRVGFGPLLALGFFAASLSPMLGFISLYTFLYSYVADHYQYVAALGPITLLAVAITRKWRIKDREYEIPLAVPILILAVLGFLTWRQASLYRNAETLWRDTAIKNPSSWMAYNNLGLELAHQHKYDEAIAEYEKCLKLKPGYTNAHLNIAIALTNKHRMDEAIRHLETAVKISPKNADAQYCLACGLAIVGRFTEAYSHYEKALDITPNDIRLHVGLGIAYATQGNMNKAIEHFRHAVDINPRDPDVRYFLACALASKGRYDEAVVHYRAGVEISPNDARMHTGLGAALMEQGKINEAIEQFREALSIAPTYKDAREALEQALKEKR